MTPRAPASDVEPVLASPLEPPHPIDPGEVAELLLGGRRTLSREMVAELAGVSISDARRFWHALGFPVDDLDQGSLTEADLLALFRLAELIRENRLPKATALAMTRAVGRTADRLGSWQVTLLAEHLGQDPQAPNDDAAVLRSGDRPAGRGAGHRTGGRPRADARLRVAAPPRRRGRPAAVGRGASRRRRPLARRGSAVRRVRRPRLVRLGGAAPFGLRAGRRGAALRGRGVRHRHRARRARREDGGRRGALHDAHARPRSGDRPGPHRRLRHRRGPARDPGRLRLRARSSPASATSSARRSTGRLGSPRSPTRGRSLPTPAWRPRW